MFSLSLRLHLAYDGSRYRGWQQTREGPSIQGTLRQIAQTIAGRPVQLEAASRTDAGVHAEGQVAHLIIPSCRYEAQRFLQSLRRLCPPDIAIYQAEEVALDFHPTLDAQGKTYRYLVASVPMPLMRHRVWTLSGGRKDPAQLDLPAMRRAARHLMGRQDFSAMAVDHVDNPIRDPICTLFAITIDEVAPHLVAITLQGDRFLYKMCRSIAGTLIDVGRHHFDGESLPAVLASRSRHRAGVCAPAQGLSLLQVHYDSIDSLGQQNLFV